MEVGRLSNRLEGLGFRPSTVAAAREAASVLGSACIA